MRPRSSFARYRASVTRKRGDCARNRRRAGRRSTLPRVRSDPDVRDEATAPAQWLLVVVPVLRSLVVTLPAAIVGCASPAVVVKAAPQASVDSNGPRIPLPPPSPTRFVELHAGAGVMCGRTDRGDLWCWGDAVIQIGDTKPSEWTSPRKLEGLPTAPHRKCVHCATMVALSARFPTPGRFSSSWRHRFPPSTQLSGWHLRRT